jgi:ATP-dependent RNA helicase SUPV3L1/SUV3
LKKFDGVKMRRLLPAEIAQIAGRAGRHQRDGTFGVLTGASDKAGNMSAEPAEFTEEEIYAVEEHRFAPMTKLFWRDSQPRFDTLNVLIGDLERIPHEPQLQVMPETIDLKILKRLADDPIGEDVKTASQVRRFWEVCSLPDFRQQGAETHSRFVARLWQDLRDDYIGADFVAARIAELDNMQGDIHALQGRIAAIRSWAYICQRPDWVLARDEMASRARAVEAKLSDALHGRLTERFVNRRTAILMKSLGQDASLMTVTLADDGALCVEDEPIGKVDGFRFVVDPSANHTDRKMLLSAGEKALPGILGEKARKLATEGLDTLKLEKGAIWWDSQKIATLELGANPVHAKIAPVRELAALTDADRAILLGALEGWLAKQLEPIAPLGKMEEATRDADAGSQARALLLTLIAGHGFVTREKAGLEHLPKEVRPFLRRLGVTFGALDIFAPALLKPAPRRILRAIGVDRRPLNEAMIPVIDGTGKHPSGYRPAGKQAVRIDIAEKVLKAAHEARAKSAKKRFIINPALAISTGLTPDSFKRLIGAAGFRIHPAKVLAEGVFGPPAPDSCEWRPSRSKPQHKSKSGQGRGQSGGQFRGKHRSQPSTPPNENSPFASLAGLVR